MFPVFLACFILAMFGFILLAFSLVRGGVNKSTPEHEETRFITLVTSFFFTLGLVDLITGGDWFSSLSVAVLVSFPLSLVLSYIVKKDNDRVLS